MTGAPEKWNEILGWIGGQSDREVDLLEGSGERSAHILESLSADSKSYFGAFVECCGGMVINKGIIRVFGAPSSEKYRDILSWNETCGTGLNKGLLLVADDVFGNFYAINLGFMQDVAIGNMCALYADETSWSGLDSTFAEFLSWLVTGDLGIVFDDFPVSTDEIFADGAIENRVFSFYPPLYTKEGTVKSSARRLVPAREEYLLRTQLMTLGV